MSACSAVLTNIRRLGFSNSTIRNRSVNGDKSNESVRVNGPAATTADIFLPPAVEENKIILLKY